jgi:septal ring factor EnvC (AmiA/AmiB activator)
MENGTVRTYLEIAQLILTILAIVFAWWRTREKVADRRYAGVERRLSEFESNVKLNGNRYLTIEQRLTELGQEVKSHADCKYHQGFERRLDETNKEIAATNKEINQLNGSIKHVEGVVEGRMKGIGSALDMIQQHLINGGK